MKRLCSILILFLAIPSSAQLSVEWNFSDFTGNPERVRRVIIQPLSTYGIWGNRVLIGERLTLFTSVRGGIVVSNVYPGAYRVRLYGKTAIAVFTNYFPPDLTGHVNAADYMAGPTRLPGGEVAYSAAASDARYMTNTSEASWAGYILTLTDTNGNYGWYANYGSSDAIRNNQDGLTLGGTFRGRYFGDGSGLTNVLNMSLATNYSRIPQTNYSQCVLAGFGNSDVNGTYFLAGSLDGSVYFTNDQYMVVSNLMPNGRWGVTNSAALYYVSPRTNASGYPLAATWITSAGGTAPGGTFTFLWSFTNGNGFAEVEAGAPVLFQDGNTQARVETYGSDATGRIGFTPVMPFASIDGVTKYLTNSMGNPTNNGVILIGAGSFAGTSMPILSGQSLIGLGRGVSIISSVLHARNSNVLENLTLSSPLNNTAYGIACTNVTLFNVDIGTPNPSNVIDGVFNPTGSLGGGFHGFTARLCHFASSWDLTQGVVTGTFDECRLDTEGGPLNIGAGLHPYTVGEEDCFYIIRGGEANVINGPWVPDGGLQANACVWVVATNANVRLLGPRLNHHGTNGVDYAVYNLYGNTNIVGWYFDNGVLTYVDGSSYWTNAPPAGWPPARLFDHY